MSENHDNPFAPRHPERFEPYSDPADAGRETPPDPVLPVGPGRPTEAGGAFAMSDPRIELDNGSMWLNRLGEELVAWLKTLASAAVYAKLIVTFVFQVARGQGVRLAATV